MSRETKILFGILIAVVGGLVGLFVLANGSGSSTGPSPSGSKTVVRSDSHKQGSGSVQMAEFGDFQCPACGAAEPNVEQLLKDYNGKITFYFRNFPLTQVHKNAMAGAEAAEAANAQGKYWQMHDKLYAEQKTWGEVSDPTDDFVSYAQGLGLDTTKFKQAIQAKQFDRFINQDIADGNALGVNATPTFYFNGQKYSGDSTYPALRDQVQSLLK
jgi:protein-disulfide isomerase